MLFNEIEETVCDHTTTIKAYQFLHDGLNYLFLTLSIYKLQNGFFILTQVLWVLTVQEEHELL